MAIPRYSDFRDNCLVLDIDLCSKRVAQTKLPDAVIGQVQDPPYWFHKSSHVRPSSLCHLILQWPPEAWGNRRVSGRARRDVATARSSHCAWHVTSGCVTFGLGLVAGHVGSECLISREWLRIATKTPRIVFWPYLVSHLTVYSFVAGKRCVRMGVEMENWCRICTSGETTLFWKQSGCKEAVQMHSWLCASWRRYCIHAG